MIKNIQAMRAIAALSVVLFHFAPVYKNWGGSIFFIPWFHNFGFIGVDVFFVISGYVIALTTYSNLGNYRYGFQFVITRFSRIYLGYWPFLILTWFALYFKDSPKLDLVDYTKSIFLLSTNMQVLILGIAWSLVFELFFYLVFFLLFPIPRQYTAVILLNLFIAVFVLNIFELNKYNSSTKFIISPYILEFLSGCLLFHYKKLLFKRFLFFPIIVVSVMAFYAGFHNDYRKGLERVCSYGMFSLCLVWVALFCEQHRVYQAKRWLISLGDCSYTIYLSHICFIYLLTLFKDPINQLNLPFRELIALIYIGVIVGFSLMFYRSVELPMYQYVKHKIRSFKSSA